MNICCKNCGTVWTIEDGSVYRPDSRIVADMSVFDKSTCQELIVYPGEDIPEGKLRFYCRCGDMIALEREHPITHKLILDRNFRFADAI